MIAIVRLSIVVVTVVTICSASQAEHLSAGAAKVDITNYDAGPVHDPLYVRALVIKSDEMTFVLLTLDAVAIGEIGYVKDDYLPTVREALENEFGVSPSHVMANASHCHGVVAPDVAEKSIQSVREALAKVEPVRVGVGTGHEDRVQENRRLKLKSGREADVRHAYSLPADEEVAAIGPIDPEIGVLRLDRLNGTPLAIVYNFACHPIQGVPSGGNTADITGFASKVIEENLGPETIALFVQGCGGDINPVFYKDVDHPRDAEPLGNLLGLSTLAAVREIDCHETDQFTVLNETIALPRGDRTDRIAELEAERRRLVDSLGGTSLNLKTFLPLIVKYNLAEQFPSYYSHRYLLEEKLGREELSRLDAENRRNIEAYLKNVHSMEQITRINTNLRLLNKHQASLVASGKRTIDVELLGLRLGDFRMITFPGELTVRIGLNIKAASPHEQTFVAGYTNGYIYYAPTADQLENVGYAQEDSDCILAPEWQNQFETKAAELLNRL